MIVNEKCIKEYEEMSLCDFADELVEPLCTIKKDLTKTIYIHYAEERDKNDELEQENARLKDKIDKAVEYIKNIDKFEERLNDDTRIYMIQDVDVEEIERILKEN